jgi:hypothetical protein
LNDPRSAADEAARAPFDDDLAFRKAKPVASQTLDGEAVILQLASGTYFTLNESGTLVWDLLQRERTVAELMAALLEAFDVDAATARRDLDELLRDLLAHRLIEATATGAALDHDR